MVSFPVASEAASTFIFDSGIVSSRSLPDRPTSLFNNALRRRSKEKDSVLPLTSSIRAFKASGNSTPEEPLPALDLAAGLEFKRDDVEETIPDSVQFPSTVFVDIFSEEEDTPNIPLEIGTSSLFPLLVSNISPTSMDALAREISDEALVLDTLISPTGFLDRPGDTSPLPDPSPLRVS